MAQKLVESYDQCDFTIVEDTHGKPLRVGGEMQLADVKNANGRIYSEALWNRVFNSQKTMERLRGRRMVGELDHPPSGKTTARQISHVMTELRMQDSKRFPGKTAIYGVYECIPTPDGKILETLHRSKIGIAVSSRGDGDLEERGGDSYVIPESYELDTFDAVMDPSVNVQVGVLENLQEKGKTCGCVSNRAVENLVRAIYGIVENGDFDKNAAIYYRSILEGVDNDNSETYLMATEALRELTNHLEVTKVMKPNESAAPPTQHTSVGVISEQRAAEIMNENTTLKTQLADLNTKLEAANKRAGAGERLCHEFMIQARGLKMQNESMVAKTRDYDVLRKRYESAKVVLGKMREQIIGLQSEGKLRIAAERLLGALLSKIDEAKRNSYVEKMLMTQPVEHRQRLRPLLQECKSMSDVNRLVLVFKSTVNETRERRQLPPVNEHGRRSTKIPATSVLLESKTEEGKQPTGTRAINEEWQSQVDFTKAVVRSGRV